MLDFKNKNNNRSFESKHMDIYISANNNLSIYIRKKYLSSRPYKYFDKSDKAIKYITKSLEIDKDLFL